MALVGQSSLLEVLKKKMRTMKDDLEAAKELNDATNIRLTDELRRREEVKAKKRFFLPSNLIVI